MSKLFLSEFFLSGCWLACSHQNKNITNILWNMPVLGVFDSSGFLLVQFKRNSRLQT